MSGQHGGYWRHDFIDHNYLYNLYFPPEDFFSHLTRHIHQLVLSYPVGQNELARLVGELIDQPLERIVVGNGAAELIKIIAGLDRKMIVPVPSFNEYANVMPADQVVEFALEAPTFQLDVDRFAAEAILSKHGFICSMSGKGNCYDNAVMESFYHTLKVELVYGHRYRTREEAQMAIFDYIEIFYNRQRLHSSLNYQTPEAFERAA